MSSHLRRCLLVVGLLGLGPGGALGGPLSNEISESIEALNEADLPGREEAVRTLARNGSQAMPALEEVMSKGSWWAREGAMEAMAAMGEAGLARLVRLAREDDRVEVRRFATRMIGRAKGAGARDALFERMKDAQVRSVAAAALGEVGDTAAVPILIEGLKDGSQGVRRACSASLGRLRDPRAVGPLVGLVGDPHQGVRFAAAGALATIGPASMGGLLETLGHPDALVRALAVDAAGEIGGPSGTSMLLRASKDSDWGVRAAAARGLGLCGGPQCLPTMRAWLAQETDPFVVSQLREAIIKVQGRPSPE